jgi:hypothetical protein
MGWFRSTLAVAFLRLARIGWSWSNRSRLSIHHSSSLPIIFRDSHPVRFVGDSRSSDSYLIFMERRTGWSHRGFFRIRVSSQERACSIDRRGESVSSRSSSRRDRRGSVGWGGDFGSDVSNCGRLRALLRSGLADPVVSISRFLILRPDRRNRRTRALQLPGAGPGSVDPAQSRSAPPCSSCPLHTEERRRDGRAEGLAPSLDEGRPPLLHLYLSPSLFLCSIYPFRSGSRLSASPFPLRSLRSFRASPAKKLCGGGDILPDSTLSPPRNPIPKRLAGIRLPRPRQPPLHSSPLPANEQGSRMAR